MRRSRHNEGRLRRGGTAVPGLLRPRSPGRVERLCGRALVRTTVTAIQLLYRLADHCGVKLARTPRSRSSSAAASCTSRHDSLRAARPRGDRRAAAGITTAHVLSSATPPPRAPGSPPTRTSSDPWSLAGDPARDVHLGIGSEGRRGAAAARSAGRGPAHRSRTDTCPIRVPELPADIPFELVATVRGQRRPPFGQPEQGQPCHRPLTGDRPQPDGPIVPGGGQQVPGRAEGHRPHTATVPGQGVQVLAGQRFVPCRAKPQTPQPLPSASSPCSHPADTARIYGRPPTA